MAIYMKYKGGAVKGDVTEDGHKQWISLSSVQWGVGRSIGAAVGNAVNREASHPSVSEIMAAFSTSGPSPHLCRCGTYDKIIKGVQRAAELMA